MREGGLQEQHGPSLSDLDDAAVESLVEGGWEPAELRQPLRRRAERLEGLLRPLVDCCPQPDDALTDLTLLRCRRAREGTSGEAAEPRLYHEDRDALDALVTSGFRPGRVPAALRDRAHKHVEVADLVSQTPVATPATRDLAERTVARIEGDVRGQREVLKLEAQAGRRGLRIRWGDAAAIAALVLLSFSLIAPAMANLRDQWERRICHTNMLSASMGLGGYALDNGGALPTVTAGSQRPWWSVGDPSASNSANLFHLAAERYVSVEDLACAGNEHALRRLASRHMRDWRNADEVSYSYQVMNGRARPSWAAPARVVVVADRSPVVRKAMARQPIDPFENSANHGSSGQHLLYNDGSSRWAESPVLESGDNIWLPRPLEVAIDRAVQKHFGHTLHGTEKPASADDTFLGP